MYWRKKSKSLTDSLTHWLTANLNSRDASASKIGSWPTWRCSPAGRYIERQEAVGIISTQAIAVTTSLRPSCVASEMFIQTWPDWLFRACCKYLQDNNNFKSDFFILLMIRLLASLPKQSYAEISPVIFCSDPHSPIQEKSTNIEIFILHYIWICLLKYTSNKTFYF